MIRRLDLRVADISSKTPPKNKALKKQLKAQTSRPLSARQIPSRCTTQATTLIYYRRDLEDVLPTCPLVSQTELEPTSCEHFCSVRIRRGW